MERKNTFQHPHSFAHSENASLGGFGVKNKINKWLFVRASITGGCVHGGEVPLILFLFFWSPGPLTLSKEMVGFPVAPLW